MQLINKYAVALVASLAAVGEAEHHGLHARLFNPRGYNGTFPTSHTAVTPTTLHSSSVVASRPVSSSVVPSSKAISSPASIPLSSSVPGSGASQSSGSGSTTDLTLTYTVGTGTSTSVVTTTIHRTATDIQTVYAVSTSSIGRSGIIRLTVS